MAESEGMKCPHCGGPLVVENFNEATIARGKCGYSKASHFGGGETQETPCKGRFGNG